MSLLSRPLHLWGTLPWGWPRWRDGLLAHLWRWKSQQDDQWGCVPKPAEVSLPAILPETGVEESDLWLRDLAQKHKSGGKCWWSIWKKEKATILVTSTVKEMDASWSLYQPDSTWWPSLRPSQGKVTGSCKVQWMKAWWDWSSICCPLLITLRWSRCWWTPTRCKTSF